MVIGGPRTQQEEPADLSVQTSMVEPADVLERLEREVIQSAPGMLMNQLSLVQAVERLGERVAMLVAA